MYTLAPVTVNSVWRCFPTLSEQVQLKAARKVVGVDTKLPDNRRLWPQPSCMANVRCAR